MNITRLTPLLVLLLACAMYFITYFVLNSGDSFSLEIIMKYEKPAQVQIFWDSGARFNAQENTSFAADPGEHRYNIDIPKNINGIRIDPMQAPGVVFIKKIELKGIAASYRWDFSNMFSGWSDHSQIKLTGLDEINGLKIESMGNDPTFSNNRWAEAESHLHEQTIIIGIIIAGLSVLAVVAACKGVRLKVLAGLFQICVITAVSFGLSEAALRAYNAYHPSFIFYDASYNRFRGRPHAKDFDFTLNSKGFKDIEFKSKQKDTFRIVAIGDSFAYGIVPYRYNYLTVLEERFYGLGKKVEIMNMGIPSTQPHEYLAILVNEGLALEPDMVLINFFVGNDFNWLEKKKTGIISSSYVISLLQYIFAVQKKYKGRIYAELTEYIDDAPTFTDEAFLDIQKSRSYIFMRESPVFLLEVPNVMRYMKEIKAICDRKNIPLLIVGLPDESQVNKKIQAYVTEAFKQAEFDFTQPNKVLVREFAQYKIDYFDLLDAFVSGSKDKRLYKPNDTHWNLAGNKLAADRMASYMFPLIPDGSSTCVRPVLDEQLRLYLPRVFFQGRSYWVKFQLVQQPEGGFVLEAKDYGEFAQSPLIPEACGEEMAISKDLRLHIPLQLYPLPSVTEEFVDLQLQPIPAEDGSLKFKIL